MFAIRKAGLPVAAVLTALLLLPVPAHAIGEGEDETEGDLDGQEVSATASRIRITYTGGDPGNGNSPGTLTSVDPNWEPPTCWYEPVATPEQLEAYVDSLEARDALGAVNANEWWSSGLFVDHYENEEPAENFDWLRDGEIVEGGGTMAEGYRDYNRGEDGYFWRSVVREGKENEPEAWDCGRIMFWEDRGVIPDDPNAPDAETLAEYAYDKVRVPDTEVEMAPEPEAKSVVNLPTWMWLDEGTFRDVKVRAELPGTGLWAETTATPKSLTLKPGTDDAELYPPDGVCHFNDDGSIGEPYAEGNAEQEPPCGVKYLRATTGQPPFELNAAITWEVSWEGTDDSGDLPDGIFDADIEVPVKEIQVVVPTSPAEDG